MHNILVVVFLLSSFRATLSARNLLHEEQAILKRIFENYDPKIRPTGENGTGPVSVEVNTYIRRISNIDDINMAYDTQLTFRQKWRDDRLRYANDNIPYLSLSSTEKIWIPDIFFSNELRGHFHDLVTPNNLIRIFPNGEVLFSTRISLHLACPMNLQDYPFDNPVCKIIMASYGYTTDHIVFLWKKGDPVQVTKSLHMTKFKLESFLTEYCTSRTNTGEYSCLQVVLEFARESNPYRIRLYMPTAALVILSWFTLWIPAHKRLVLGLALLVAILFIVNSKHDLPQVSYVTGLDVWLGTCITFVFIVLVETIVASTLRPDDSGDLTKSSSEGKQTVYTSMPLKLLNNYKTKDQRIDFVSRLLYPVAFLLFNFIYWLTY